VLRNRATISRDPPVHPGGFALGAIGNVHRRRRIGRPCLTADGPAGDGCLLAQTRMTPTQSRRDTSPATIVSDRDSDRDRHAGRSACNSASPRPRVIDIPAANTARSRRGTRAARPIRRCLLTSARAHKIAIGESGLTTSASLIGRLGSSAYRLSTSTVSMSLTGSCFSSESALRPFHHGIRRRGGTIFGTALPSV